MCVCVSLCARLFVCVLLFVCACRVAALISAGAMAVVDVVRKVVVDMVAVVVGGERRCVGRR